MAKYIVSVMVESNADAIARSFQGYPVTPTRNGPSNGSVVPACNIVSYSPENATVHAHTKQGSFSSLSKPLQALYRRKSSSAVALPNTVSCYAGPQPMGPNGCPLRSCLKPSPSSSSGASIDMSTRSDSSGHRVSFSHVQIREYCRQVGDNPSVSSGCPLGIGWKYNYRGKIDIDSYEADLDKDPVPCQRLSAKERENILTDIGGISHTRIIQGQVQAHFERQLRAETVEQIGGLRNCKSVGPRERLFIMKESAARKLDRAKRGISPDQEQQQLWDEAREAAKRKSLSDAEKPSS